MSFIRVTFTHPLDVADVVDVVEVLQAVGFPVRGKASRFFVLHDSGQVSQWATTLDAQRALKLPGSELLVWLLPDAAVAAVVVVDGVRISCHLGLSGSPAQEQQAAARAIEQLLPHLVDVDLQAELDPMTG